MEENENDKRAKKYMNLSLREDVGATMLIVGISALEGSPKFSCWVGLAKDGENEAIFFDCISTSRQF